MAGSKQVVGSRWCGGYDLNLNLKGTKFESLPGYKLGFTLVFSSFQKNACRENFQILLSYIKLSSYIYTLNSLLNSLGY